MQSFLLASTWISWELKNWCFWTVVLEKTFEGPLDCKEIKSVNPKENQSWIFIGRIEAEAETPILWPPDVKNWLTGKRPWCWKRLKAGGEGDDSGWDGWMASPTQWTWVWASSGSWWWTGKPGVLQSMGSQRVRHDWETKLKWIKSRTSIWWYKIHTFVLDSDLSDTILTATDSIFKVSPPTPSEEARLRPSSSEE